MANSNPSRFGSVNQTGDTRALWLKMFAGEVFTAWAENNVTLDKHYVRSIPSGKSASFPMIGKTDADYHVPGTELTGTGINTAEQVISIDDMLVAHSFLAEIDEAMSHFDVRRPYAQEQGRALARKFDKNVLTVGLRAARSVSPLTDGNGGSTIVSATALTNGLALAQAITDAARVLDEKDIPEEDRYAYVRPAQYQLLLKDAKDFIDFDFNREDNGSLSTGKIGRIAGVKIVKTNHLPRTNVTTGLTKYQGNFANTAALIMNRMAVGTVKLIDVTVATQDDLRRLGTLLVSRNAIGTDVLRPDCAVEIATA